MPREFAHLEAPGEKAPDADMIRLFYEEQRERITNSRSAMPDIKPGAMKNLPPPPSSKELEEIKAEQKNRIRDVKRAEM